jgi:hypothetical protein
MELSFGLSVLAAIFLWGGAAIYIFDKPTSINPVPWIVWAAASFVAAVNTAVEDGLSRQVLIYAGTGLFFAAVVLRRRRVLVWESLPAWHKISLPFLVASPVVTIWASPLVGIGLQTVFAWVTAGTFIQTAASGSTRDPVSAWWVELTGCVLLLVANDFLSRSWILPLNSSLLSAACLAAIYVGKGKHA